MDRYTNILLTIIAICLSAIALVELGFVLPAHAVSTNVAVEQMIDAMQKEHAELATLIPNGMPSRSYESRLR